MHNLRENFSSNEPKNPQVLKSWQVMLYFRSFLDHNDSDVLKGTIMLIVCECLTVDITYFLLLCETSAGSLSNCDEDVIETNDSTKLKVETTNEDVIMLEETCVFINENNISFASYKDGKPWSYKVFGILVCLYL